MREAWIQLLLCIHLLISSWIPFAGVSGAVFSCANSELNMSFFFFVADAFGHQRITSIK